MDRTSWGANPRSSPRAVAAEDWHERFIRPAGIPIDERLVRRCAAIQLVRRAAHCDTHEAALLLGIPTDKVPSGIDDDRFWIGAKDAPTDFRIAMVELGLHLGENVDRLPDYQRRRDALRGWVLRQDDWREVTAQLQPEPVAVDRPGSRPGIAVADQITPSRAGTRRAGR